TRDDVRSLSELFQLLQHKSMWSPGFINKDFDSVAKWYESYCSYPAESLLVKFDLPPPGSQVRS
ncbi:hypothetical protein N9B45_03260, partial [bacterium]|nr:hypothetical protein [bacterium]